MFRLVILFALVSCTFAGTDTTIQKHPYQVSLQTKSGNPKCGGAIINPDTIVTAGHCVYNQNPSDYKIRLGSTKYNSGGELVEIKAFRIHEQFNAKTQLNDIGIIKLARPVRESDTVRRIELASKTPETDTTAIVTSWGEKCFGACGNYSIILQETEVDILDTKECASSKFTYGSRVHPSMICGYPIPKESCLGDSGAPLVAGSKLVGVVSWGDGCAWQDFPEVYAEVAYFRKWILATANSL